MSRRQLRALARDCGIQDEYRANDGSRRFANDMTREALLAAMGLDASSERSAARLIREQQERDDTRVLDVVDVLASGRSSKLRARAPDEWRGRIAQWSLTLVADEGARTLIEGSARVDRARVILIRRPPLASGVYEACLRLECGGETLSATQWTFAAPPACVEVENQLGQPRAYGFWAHVYALKQAGDYGIGDLGHLAKLVSMAREEGAAFVSVQPFHALGNTLQESSPYSPTTRLFRNPIYLDLEAVPEFRKSEAVRNAIRDLETQGEIETLRKASRIDYAAVMDVKRRVLALLFREFRSEYTTKTTKRGRAYREFVDREGTALQRYAAYCALADTFGGNPDSTNDWRVWPRRFHDPNGRAVQEFVRDRKFDVEFHCWLQFETERQLVGLGARAEETLPLGLMGDLAIGSGRGSADLWMHNGLFVDGASLGAPPDAFADGQDWELPPLHPMRSRADGHAYWRRVLSCAFRGMGSLRIDHVMGLFRQFWIPAGRPPAEGAYVELPSRELLALLAIESHRARAVVVGEDLGTRPAALSPRLARAGILSTRVLPFEQTSTGFRAADRYGARAYVTSHTHDLPPLLGWCEGRDLELRHEAGEFKEPGTLRAAQEERRREVAALRRRLVRDGWLTEDVAHPNRVDALAPALTAFLGSTHAPLLALSVDDLVGERDPLNLPGIGTKSYPNWARRMAIGVDVLRGVATARAIIDSVPSERRLNSQQ